MRRRLGMAVLAMVLLVQALGGTASALEVREVAGEFICNCGCNKNLAACEMKCGDNLRGFIKDKIGDGLGKQQIMAYMKENFQQAILAAPEKSGFNLTAWITPFAVVFAGGVGIVKAMSTWSSRRKEDDDPGEDVTGDDDRPDSPKGSDSKYDDQIEKELKDFGW